MQDIQGAPVLAEGSLERQSRQEALGRLLPISIRKHWLGLLGELRLLSVPRSIEKSRLFIVMATVLQIVIADTAESVLVIQVGSGSRHLVSWLRRKELNWNQGYHPR